MWATARLAKISALTWSSTCTISSGVMARAKVKSKRSSSGPTKEPAWLTCEPSTCLRAACRRWVAVWCRMVASRRARSTLATSRSPTLGAWLPASSRCTMVAPIFWVSATRAVPIRPWSPTWPPDSA
ncbi:hypothetical protein D3C86_1460260 [compost metagenome]